MPQTLRDLQEVQGQFAGCALVIGNFDGVHRGHQQILAHAVQVARCQRAPVVALTFDPHPLKLLRPAAAPAPLTPLDEKVSVLRAAGVHEIVVLHTTPELLAMSAEDFLEAVVARRFAPAWVVEGPSFGFGRGRLGTPAVLSAAGPRLGFEVCIVEPVHLEIHGRTVAVSSSLVRELLGAGQVQDAAKCLGRPYALLGEVQHGRERGRTLGFPTANLGRIAQLVPGEGVYAGWAETCGGRYAAAISIGVSPTFANGVRQVEAHLLECSADLYGAGLRLEFIQHLRDQQRFADPAALQAQVAQDVGQVRMAFSAARGGGSVR